jgi:nucleosome binding factor SPN SPT16 subunit
LWLLNWEFSDTLLVLTPTKIVFNVSAKKAKLLRDMKVPVGYSGPTLVVLEQNPKVDSA